MGSDVVSVENPPHFYRLYFKGLVRENLAVKGITTAVKSGFGIAICDHNDNLLFKTKGLLQDKITPMEAEIRALIRGLDEALRLRITHISIFCDSYPIFKHLSGISDPKEEKIALIMDHVKRIRNRFQSSNPLMVFEKHVNNAYELAMDAIVSQTRRPLFSLFRRQAKKAKKEACVICFDDDIDPDLMFSVDKCGHRFCLNCMKQHIEVKLLDGTIPKCPQHYCKSLLCIDTCGKLLNHKLSLMWKLRIREDSTPFNERVYCPSKRCSYFMSKSELFLSFTSGLRICFKCGGSFCVHCKVPWHSRLSCTDYKNLHASPRNDDNVKLKSLAKLKGWRQCGNCHHMVERSSGCTHMTCRCGNAFCYDCGAEWDGFVNHMNCYARAEHDTGSISCVICGVLLLVMFVCMVCLILRN